MLVSAGSHSPAYAGSIPELAANFIDAQLDDQDAWRRRTERITLSEHVQAHEYLGQFVDPDEPRDDALQPGQWTPPQTITEDPRWSARMH